MKIIKLFMEIKKKNYNIYILKIIFIFNNKYYKKKMKNY